MAEIKVVITDETGNTTQQTVPNGGSNSTKTPTQSVKDAGATNTTLGKESQKSSQAMSIAAMIASRAFNYTTSNVGKWTGSSIAQNRVNTAQQAASLAAMAYVNPYVAAANVGMNLATTALNNAFDEKINSAEKQRVRNRAGYTENGNVLGRRHK